MSTSKRKPTATAAEPPDAAAANVPAVDRVDQPTREAEWSTLFLATLSHCGNIRASCRTTGISRAAVYKRRDRDPEFADAWDEAIENAVDTLEGEAWRRAVIGTEKPVFYKGEKCGSVREYSDQLLVVLLRALRPERFRDTFDLKKILAALPECPARS